MYRIILHIFNPNLIIIHFTELAGNLSWSWKNRKRKGHDGQNESWCLRARYSGVSPQFIFMGCASVTDFLQGFHLIAWKRSIWPVSWLWFSFQFHFYFTCQGLSPPPINCLRRKVHTYCSSLSSHGKFFLRLSGIVSR